MKSHYLVLFCFLVCLRISAQEMKYVYRDAGDSTHNFYVKLIPSVPVKGILVLNNQELSATGNEYAMEKGILVACITPGYSDSYYQNMVGKVVLRCIDTLIHEIVTAHKVPADKIIIGGMSDGGTGAIRYAQYCAAGKSAYHIKTAGVFAADPPLDYERMWYEAVHSIERKDNVGAVVEALALNDMFFREIRDIPGRNQSAYQQLSPYSYTAAKGGNAGLLNNMHVRLYTEPDINWWIENRKIDYYGMNALDVAGMINQLKLNGNTNAELIITENKGYIGEVRYPHAWSIVDQKGLIDWCLQVFNSKQP